MGWRHRVIVEYCILEESLRRAPPCPDATSGLALTVILVDDDDDFRIMFAEALRLNGTGVIEAAEGRSAIAVLDCFAQSRDDDPGLMMLDLMMPVMSGVEVLQRLRCTQRWAQLPVLIMTAVNDAMLPVTLNVPVVFKPDLETLLTAVRQNLMREMTCDRTAGVAVKDGAFPSRRPVQVRFKYAQSDECDDLIVRQDERRPQRRSGSH
jgi:CheY-like chemotaxis protein